MDKIPQVKIHRALGAELPVRATLASAALDIHACLPPDTVCNIEVGQRMLIPTGLQFEIPEGYFISIRPRSGLALKQGLCLPNAPGTIDSDYRGELKILVANFAIFSKVKTIEIKHGDRIAQMLLEKQENFSWLESDEPFSKTKTERGDGGFGSTGTSLLC